MHQIDSITDISKYIKYNSDIYQKHHECQITTEDHDER